MKKSRYIVKVFCADPGCCRLVTVEMTDGPLREPLCEACHENRSHPPARHADPAAAGTPPKPVPEV